jgi:AraC-like DNA-binding protein
MDAIRNSLVTRCTGTSAVPTRRTRRDLTRLPLTGHPVLRTRDPVAAQQAISEHLWPTRLRIDGQPGPGGRGFEARLHHTRLGATGLAYLSCDNVATSATLAADPGGNRAVLVALPWAGTVECWRGRENTTVADRTAVVIQPGRLTLTHWHPGAALLLVVLPECLVTEILGDLTGDPAPAPPVFELAQTGLSQWARLIHAVCGTLDTGGLLDHPLATRYLQQALIVGLLTAARHDHSEQVHTTGIPGRRLRPAVDWIHTHFGDPTIGAADIARAAGLSQRTLYRAVRQETGMTPAEYLRRVRLVAARAALRAATPADTTVTEVAGRAGFSDLSWFAVQYQRAYGERPVDTLRTRTTV